MGKQFGFIMDATDENEFIKMIIDSGGKVFQNKKRGAEKGSVQVYSLPEDIWINLYLAKDEFGEMNLRNIENEIQYIDSYASPVIEFGETIPRIKLKQIQRGRLYLVNKYWDENEQLIQKDEGLDKWYKELVKWIKKRLKCVETFPYDRVVKQYVSESLVKYVEDGFHLLG